MLDPLASTRSIQCKPFVAVMSMLSLIICKMQKIMTQKRLYDVCPRCIRRDSIQQCSRKKPRQLWRVGLCKPKVPNASEHLYFRLVPARANKIVPKGVSMDNFTPSAPVITTIPMLGVPCIKKGSNIAVHNKSRQLTRIPLQVVKQRLNLLIPDLTIGVVQL